ncbi:MAG TPA: MauE/DoxX family redox-associated membrane protein [candidate division Zixibacteria bacterium]
MLKTLVRVITDKRMMLLFRLILGITFIYASLDKISNPDQFARIIYNYHIIPRFLINVYAVTLPWVELFAGLFLILGVFTESASLLICFLLSVFVIAISINLFRGVNLNCGCFSTDPAGAKEGAKLLIKDFVFLFLGIMIFFFNKSYASLTALIQNKSTTKQ